MNRIIFDAHCDTVSKIARNGGSLYKNNYHIDILRAMEKKRVFGQVFAAFVDKNDISTSPFEYVRWLIDTYFNEINNNKENIAHCSSCLEIENALKAEKMVSILAIEGGEAIEGDINKLEMFFDLGVRVMTLTWNYENEICDSAMSGTEKGLSDFGKQVVSKMNNLGMLIDVSHISNKGFWDVVGISEKPVAATHSNASKIRNHPRNLDDEQIKALVKNNGFIGINLYSEFLSDQACEIKDVLMHVEHILSLGGENVIGFGCDFDGCNSLPDGICGVQDIEKIIDVFKSQGYSDDIIEKIMYKNFLRVLKDTI